MPVFIAETRAAPNRKRSSARTWGGRPEARCSFGPPTEWAARRSNTWARAGRPEARCSFGRQFPKLALDLRLHVERLLALSHAPLVAGDHELPHLVAKARVGRCRARLGELGDLGLDVEGRLSARHTPIRLRLDELPYLLIRLSTCRRAPRLRP